MRPRQAAQAAGAEVLGNVATRFVNSVIVMSFILHPVVVRPLAIGSVYLDVLREQDPGGGLRV